MKISRLLRVWPRILPLSLWAFLTVAVAGAAADEVSGHLKSLNLSARQAPGGILPGGESSSNNLRLDLSGEGVGGGRWEVSLDTLLIYADPPPLRPLPGESPNRVADLESNFREGEHLSGRVALDRLNLRGRWGAIDWSVGRQAIGFGRITLFSPLDIVAPFPPDALDTDVRPGVDALRAVRYFGLGGQFGATAVLGASDRDHSLLLTASHNLSGIDLLGLAGSLRDREAAGFGLAGSLGGLGLKGEASYYRGKRGDLHESFTIAAAEGWYRFDNGLMLLTEYLFNGAGAKRPENYPRAALAATHREGLSFLLGRHYLLLAPSYELHPLATLSGLMILNLEDHSFLLRPLLDLSLADNWTLQLFWSFNQGRRPLRAPVILPRSEFGTVGDGGGLFLKYFF